MTRFKLVYLNYRHECEIQYLQERVADNIDVIGIPPGASEERIATACIDADMVIPWKMGFPLEIARRTTRLKLLQTLGSGVDRLDVEPLTELGIAIANNAGSNRNAVAEITIFLIIAVYRQLHLQMKQLAAGAYHDGFFERWEDFHELAGKRVGIIGLGHIGFSVARRLAGFECEIVYYDTATTDATAELAAGAKRLVLDELLKTSDVVTLHVPLTPATRGLISDAQFNLMKLNTIIINTSRGQVIDESALIRALDSQRIAGAGLDVTEVEPIPTDHPLHDRNNVVLTPHLGGLAIEGRHRALDLAITNANRLATAKEPVSVVNCLQR